MGGWWRYVSEDVTHSWLVLSSLHCSWSAIGGGLGWILPPESGWALIRLPMAVVTASNLPELRCLDDILKTLSGILGVVLCRAWSWTWWSMWVPPSSGCSVILWSKSSPTQEGFFYSTGWCLPSFEAQLPHVSPFPKEGDTSASWSSKPALLGSESPKFRD